jgi:hypothetical protein
MSAGTNQKPVAFEHKTCQIGKVTKKSQNPKSVQSEDELIV